MDRIPWIKLPPNPQVVEITKILIQNSSKLMQKLGSFFFYKRFFEFYILYGVPINSNLPNEATIEN